MDTPASDERKRVALLIESDIMPAWQCTIVEKLSADESVDLVASIYSEKSVLKQGKIRPTDSRVCRLLGVHTKNGRAEPASALHKSNAISHLRDLPKYRIHKGVGSQYVDIKQLTNNDIGDLNLDIILSLSQCAPHPDFASSATCEFWYFVYGSGKNTSTSDFEFGLFEMLNGDPYLETKLLRQVSHVTKPEILYETRSAIYVHPPSLSRSLSEHFMKLSNIVSRCLASPGQRGYVQYSKGSQLSKVARLGRKSTFAYTISLGWYIVRRAAKMIQRRRYKEAWGIYYSLGNHNNDFSKFESLASPQDKFWADPFVVYRDETYFIFIEEADVASGKGRICVACMDRNGQHKSTIPIIERSYHLSYPFVFEWNEEWYLIPESADNRCIEVYKCKDFPERWVLHSQLMDNVEAYDVTLHHQDGLWWLFCTMPAIPGGSGCDELHLFYSDTPLSASWQAHPQNPVVSDVVTARPAGRLFRRDGKILRPSQNSSFRYGYGLKFSEVTELSVSSYAETEIASFEPDWHRSIKALHTYSREKELTVIDAITAVPS